MKAHDLWGKLALPMSVPEVGDPLSRTRAIGDPALVTVASFLATVLIAEVGEASAALWPSFPEFKVDGDLGAGFPPVRRIFFFQPRQERPFVAADLPCLFVFRYGGEKSTYERLTADTHRTNIPMVAWWVVDRTDPTAEEYRDPFINAVGKALMGAVNDGYHRAWVLDGDKAKPGTLLANVPATMSVNTVSGAAIDGALSTVTMRPARSVLLQTVKQAGAYTPGGIIGVEGIDGRGHPWSDSVTITQADGGEELITTFRFRTIQSVTFPAQAGTTGTFTMGWGQSPEAATGSRILLAARLSRFVQRNAGDVKTFTFKIGENIPEEQSRPVNVPYRAFEMVFECIEDWEPNYELHGASPNSADGSYVLPNGELFAAHDIL